MASILPAAKAASVNPLKSSQPLGAAFAFLGVEGAVPLFHGSQGCTSFALVLFVRHFKEAIPLQTTAMDEVATILGGADHLGGSDPQSEDPRQAEADRRLHHGAGRDARRGFCRRTRIDQGAPRRRSRWRRDRAGPDARFRRRDRGGLEQGGHGDDLERRAARGGATPQREARQYPARRAPDRRRHRAPARNGRGLRPRARLPARHFRLARRNRAGALDCDDLRRDLGRGHPQPRRGAPDDRHRRAHARARRTTA